MADASQPKWLWHFTTLDVLDNIRLFCRLWTYRNRAFDQHLAISFTELDPQIHDRSAISIKNWGEWIEDRMEAFVRVRFDEKRMFHAARDKEWLSQYDFRLDDGGVTATWDGARYVVDEDIPRLCHERRVRGEIPDRP